MKFSADGVMPARGDNLNSSHTLQISKLIVASEGRELGNVLDSSAKQPFSVLQKEKARTLKNNSKNPEIFEYH